MTPKNQKHQRADQVSPADESEDAIPLGMNGEWGEGNNAVAVFAAEGKGEIHQRR